MTESRINVNDYGDMFSKILGMELLFYRELGSYQGQYLVILKSEESYDLPSRIFLYKGYYGSCSGCDFIEGTRDWKDGSMDYTEALNEVNRYNPLYILPVKEYHIDFIKTLLKGHENEYDFSLSDSDYEDILKSIT